MHPIAGAGVVESACGDHARFRRPRPNVSARCQSGVPHSQPLLFTHSLPRRAGKDKDGKPVKATYVRSQLNSQPANVKDDVDPGFVNDQYWLLFALHVYWDTSANVQDKGMQGLPLGSGSSKLISVKYPSEGGYTPGDHWDLYGRKDNRVEQMDQH